MDLKRRVDLILTLALIGAVAAIMTVTGVLPRLWEIYGISCFLVLITVIAGSYALYWFIMAGTDAKRRKLLYKCQQIEAKILGVVVEEVHSFDWFVVENELTLGKARKMLYRVRCMHKDDQKTWDFYSDYVSWDPTPYLGKTLKVYVNTRNPKEYHVAVDELKDN